MELAYTQDKALRDKVCPKAFYRDNWQGQLSTGATKVYTDMAIVREAYESIGVEVEWIGEVSKPKKKRVAKKKAPAKHEIPDQNELRDNK